MTAPSRQSRSTACSAATDSAPPAIGALTVGRCLRLSLNYTREIVGKNPRLLLTVLLPWGAPQREIDVIFHCSSSGCSTIGVVAPIPSQILRFFLGSRKWYYSTGHGDLGGFPATSPLSHGTLVTHETPETRVWGLLTPKFGISPF